MDGVLILEPAFRESVPQTGEPLTVDTFLDLVGDIWSQPAEPITMMVHPKFVPRLDQWRRFGNACRVLGIHPDSAKARKITARMRSV